MAIISYLNNIIHIPFKNRRYPSYDYYKEHFFEKKIAILEKLLCNNLIINKEIILNKIYYLKDLFNIINKKNKGKKKFCLLEDHLKLVNV